MSFFRGVLGFSFVVLTAVFSVFNRAPVELIWSPVHPLVIVPLYAVALGFLLLGFLCGGFLVWLNMAALRRTKRMQKKEIKRLERELEAATKKIEESESVESPSLTLLPAHHTSREDSYYAR